VQRDLRQWFIEAVKIQSRPQNYWLWHHFPSV